jgi:hypothetical protein
VELLEAQLTRLDITPEAGNGFSKARLLSRAMENSPALRWTWHELPKPLPDRYFFYHRMGRLTFAVTLSACVPGHRYLAALAEFISGRGKHCGGPVRLRGEDHIQAASPLALSRPNGATAGAAKSHN